MNKKYRTDILVSDTTKRFLKEHAVSVSSLGKTRLKGITEAIEVWKVL